MHSNLDHFIKTAIEEDLGDGDHTSLACIGVEKTGKAQLIIKQEGVIAGIDIAIKVFNKIDDRLKLKIFKTDGARVKKDDIAFNVEGSVISILQAERLVLNIMQRMSGIATQTNKYVQKLEGLKTKVLDTRKTTPGMRYLEKLAVKTGGGENHRMGLYDMVLIKDNHIDFAGGIEKAIHQTQNYLKDKRKELKIEIEARSISDINVILKIGGVNRILLDNFSIEETREAVKLIDSRFETESSGMITLTNLREYAECGVDFISVGALTHQIQSLDMSLKATF